MTLTFSSTSIPVDGIALNPRRTATATSYGGSQADGMCVFVRSVSDHFWTLRASSSMDNEW